MAHHKRRRPKAARGGCLLCRPWNLPASRPSMPTRQERRAGPARRVLADGLATWRSERDEDPYADTCTDDEPCPRCLARDADVWADRGPLWTDDSGAPALAGGGR
jgi:hypothetical protein